MYIVNCIDSRYILQGKTVAAVKVSRLRLGNTTNWTAVTKGGKIGRIRM